MPYETFKFTHTHTHKRVRTLKFSAVLIVALGIFLGSFYSCKKSEFEPQNSSPTNATVSEQSLNIDESLYVMSHQLESKPDALLRNAMLEMTDLMKNMDEDGYKELFALLHGKYYLEGYVGLKDLLYPNMSPLYAKAEVNPELKGKFRDAFYRLFDANRYPNLNAILQRHQVARRSNTQPDFMNSADVYFYMPYPEDDNGNPFTDSDNPTYVPAVTEANEGYGWKEDNNGEWQRVVTNDDYGSSHATIIVEPNTPQNLSAAEAGGAIGGDPTNDIDHALLDSLRRRQCRNLENGTLRRSVFLGHLQVRKQFDKWLSLTGNGGGSEMYFGSVWTRSHIMQDPNNPRDVDVYQFDTSFLIYLPRKEINQMRKDFRNNGCYHLTKFRWVGAVWLPDWKCKQEEVLFAIWEDDNTVEKITHEATLGLSTDSTSTYNFTASVSIQNNSKDPIIRDLKISNTAFVNLNAIDQGCGCLNGQGVFNNICWPIWDGGTDVAYTMPVRYLSN